MAYCVLRIEKAKSNNILRQMYEHHYRFKESGNVDKDYEALNDIKVTPEKGDYIQAFHRRLDELDYYKDHSIRKNGVMAYDIILHYSPDASAWIDKEAWKDDNVNWLKKTFGEENVVSVVFHYDEAGNTEAGAIHGHAVVIPIDCNGKINASYYTGDRMKMTSLQDSYAMAMEKHNLERGIRLSTAKHTPPKKFYAMLDNAVYGTPMPEQRSGEKTEKYCERIKEAWRDERAAHVRELRDKDRKILEIRASYPQDREKDMKIKFQQEQIDQRYEQEKEIIREFGSVTNENKLAHAMRLFNEAISNYPDETIAERAFNDATTLIEWAEQSEKKRQKVKEAEREVEKIDGI